MVLFLLFFLSVGLYSMRYLYSIVHIIKTPIYYLFFYSMNLKNGDGCRG